MQNEKIQLFAIQSSVAGSVPRCLSNKVDQMLVKVTQIVSTSVIWSKFVAKNFQQSPNLVALVAGRTRFAA